MKTIIFALLGFVFVSDNIEIEVNKSSKNQIDKPLFLTDLIEKGQIKRAKLKARVHHPEMEDFESYAGYITIDKRYNSNLFFWFFLSKSNPETDPIIMWLEGGPASSALYAVFNYNGPFGIGKNLTLVPRKYTPLRNNSMLYFDNIPGAGFSFTESWEGYAKIESDVDRGVLEFLRQFFKMFPEYRNNDFYMNGDSYGGRFCVTVAQAIKHYNDDADDKSKINLKGIALGNGWINMPLQIRRANFLYQTGLIDTNDRNELITLESEIELLWKLTLSTNNSDVRKLHRYYEKDLMQIMQNLTGFDNLKNLLWPSKSYDLKIDDFVALPEYRNAVHVGHQPFYEVNYTAHDILYEDRDQSVTPALEEILDYYKILIYNGQLDMLAPYPASEEVYRALNWSAAEEYKAAKRKFWRVGSELAGYWKTAGNLQEVLVRDAGHVASFDQPKWYCDMMTRFMNGNIPK